MDYISLVSRRLDGSKRYATQDIQALIDDLNHLEGKRVWRLSKSGRWHYAGREIYIWRKGEEETPAFRFQIMVEGVVGGDQVRYKLLSYQLDEGVEPLESWAA